MATKPGDKNYKGPVGEGWGRPLKNFARDVDTALRDAAGIPGQINARAATAVAGHEASARSLLGDIGTNLLGGGTTKRDRKAAATARRKPAKPSKPTKAAAKRTKKVVKTTRKAVKKQVKAVQRKGTSSAPKSRKPANRQKDAIL